MYLESNINRLPLVFKSDAGKNYFQFHLNGQLASLEYYMEGKEVMNLVRLEVSKYLHPKDVSNALIERVLEYAYRADFKIVSLCPEVNKYIQKHARYHNLLVSGSQSIFSHNQKLYIQ